jgi:hypothetical protein
VVVRFLCGFSLLVDCSLVITYNLRSLEAADTFGRVVMALVVMVLGVIVVVVVVRRLCGFSLRVV